MDDFERVEALIASLPELADAFPGVSAQVNDDDGRAFLASVSCAERGHGTGTRWLEAFCALADRLGVDVETDPSEGDMERLGGWYARHGFEWKSDERMVRWAAAPAAEPAPV